MSNEVQQGQPRITMSGAGKRYGKLQVFRDVDLTVGEREVLAIIGPSGCGKTTLLRCIDGLIPLTEGEITVGGGARHRPARGRGDGVPAFRTVSLEDGVP